MKRPAIHIKVQSKFLVFVLTLLRSVSFANSSNETLIQTLYQIEEKLPLPRSLLLRKVSLFGIILYVCIPVNGICLELYFSVSHQTFVYRAQMICARFWLR